MTGEVGLGLSRAALGIATGAIVGGLAWLLVFLSPELSIWAAATMPVLFTFATDTSAFFVMALTAGLFFLLLIMLLAILSRFLFSRDPHSTWRAAAWAAAISAIAYFAFTTYGGGWGPPRDGQFSISDINGEPSVIWNGLVTPLGWRSAVMTAIFFGIVGGVAGGVAWKTATFGAAGREETHSDTAE
jgi:hypothetical protein